jgi:hypothetical protein
MICSTTGQTTTLPKNTVYYSGVLTVTGTGQGIEAGNASRYVICNPTFSFFPYVAGSAGTGKSNSNYGSATAQSRIANPGAPSGSVIATGFCSNGSSQVTVRYCASQPCYSAPTGSPIILDIIGKGFFLTDANDGVLFDISGDGHPAQMAWTAKGAENAFLALPGPDGLVHSGKELFGNFTSQPPSSTPNGFAALVVYDQPANGGNGDGIIDSRDAIFSSLRLWIDANHDAIHHPQYADCRTLLYGTCGDLPCVSGICGARQVLITAPIG